jgi:putative ABC transport system permease protein
VSEIRLAIRRLMSGRAAMGVSVLTLAMAVGAGAATWSLLSAVLLNPLPVRDPEGLAMVGAVHNAGAGRTVQSGVTYPHYPHVAASGVFESIAAIWLSPVPLPVGSQKAPESTPVMFVSGTFFDVLGVPISIGRALMAIDDRRGAPVVAVLSDRYWRAMFGADPDVIGRSLTVGDRTATIIGVAPRGFRGLSLAQAPAMFLPLEIIADVGPATTNYFADPQHDTSPTSGVGIIGRLRDDQSFEQVRARLATLGAPPGRSGSVSWNVIDIQTAAIPAVAREGTVRFARLLATTVALLVLIGCSTVGLLLLVRTESRRQEFATCLALGATRTQLARGIIIEGAILTTAAACLSPLVAWWLFSAVSTFQLPGGIALGLLDLTLDQRALAAIVGGAAAATLFIAIIAGAFGFRADVADSLRTRVGATPRIARRGTRAVLLATQVAIALTLVAGTGLFARSLMAALDLNRRIDSARIVEIGQVPLAQNGYSAARAATLFGDLRERLRGNPFVESVATSSSQGGMGAGGALTIDGVPRTFPAFVAFRHVDDNYFSTMRMRILRGRHFSADDVAGAPLVGIVSASFARMIGSGDEVLGRHVVMMFGGKLDIEILGVVDDLFTDIRDAEPLALYMPMTQRAQPAVNRALVFRAANDVEAAQREVLATVRQLDWNLQLPAGLTLDERLLRQMAPQQFGLFVLGSLGAIALLLTVLGTYVLAETMAVMRTRELGIRAALGATTKSLTILVLRESAVLVGLGLGAGLLLSYLGANVIRAFLFRVQPLDPATLGAVATLILLLAIAVSMRPALRAARVDLAEVLRSE